MADNCSNCRFFVALPKECHKNPPVPFIVPQGILGVFPPTKAENACGAHERATTDDNATEGTTP